MQLPCLSSLRQLLAMSKGVDRAMPLFLRYAFVSAISSMLVGCGVDYGSGSTFGPVSSSSLFSPDLAQQSRSVPATMGALEVVTPGEVIGIPPKSGPPEPCLKCT